VFDYSTLTDLLNHIYIEDGRTTASYDIFIDLSGIEIVSVDKDTVVEIVQMYRQFNSTFNRVNIAFNIPFEMTVSLAQVFRLAIEKDTILRMKIFCSIEECAEYLQVDQSILI
jgi:hypothetical protein